MDHLLLENGTDDLLLETGDFLLLDLLAAIKVWIWKRIA
jgi:hypothetical protein